MFIDNKYTKYYFNIINKAIEEDRIKNDNIYLETHHIIPKSMGGVNKKINLVNLTAREHYIVHWLLTKMVSSENKKKMILAFQKMHHSNIYHKRFENSKTYENVRKELSSLSKGSNNNFYGKKHSKETLKKISKANKGKVLSQETKKAISLNHARAGGLKGKMWICNHSTKQRMVINQNDIIPDGWVRGKKLH